MFMTKAISRCVLAALLVTFVPATSGTLCGCAKDIAIKITGVYENSDTDVHYSYCEMLPDGRGFTAGIAGFCTGTGDAWMVIEEYKRIAGSYGDFQSMTTTLKKYADDGDESSDGIENYCSVWKDLGKSDKNFQQAQDNIRDQLYYDPAEQASNKLGLQLDVTQGQLFDTAIEHGAGDDADGMQALIGYTNESFDSDQPGDSGSILNINGHKVDEIVWLKKFIEIRTDDLKHPKEKDNQGGDYWAQTIYRTESYSFIIDQKEYMWTISVKILDTDRKEMAVSCSSTGNNKLSRRSRARRNIYGKPIRIRKPRTLVPSAGSPGKRRIRPVLSRGLKREL